MIRTTVSLKHDDKRWLDEESARSGLPRAETVRISNWKMSDALQAALASIHKVNLVTRNTKDFRPDEFDWMIVPYEY